MNDLSAALDAFKWTRPAAGSEALALEANVSVVPPLRRPMLDTFAFVLAGGKGTRLGSLTARRAKPAVPIGGKYRIIDFVLSNCINSRVPFVGVLTQYMSGSLTSHLDTWDEHARQYGSSVHNLQASSSHPYRGTADAVHQSRDIIRSLAPPQVLILAADHVYRMNYASMLADHRRYGADVTVGCIEVPIAEAGSFGIMDVDADHRVTAFAEKPRAPRPIPGRPGMALASMGIYVFDTEFLLRSLSDDEEDPMSSHDFGKDVIPCAVMTARVHAHRLRDVVRPQAPAYWRDVGTIDAYWRTSREMADPVAGPHFDDARWPIRSVLDTGLGTRDRSDADSFRGGNVISPRAWIAEGAIVEDSVILPGASIGNGCVIRKAIVDEGCTLPAGTRIGVDPEDDRAHFEVSPEGIVLAAPARSLAEY